MLFVAMYIPQKGARPSQSASVQQPRRTIDPSTQGYWSQRGSLSQAAPWQVSHSSRVRSGDTAASSTQSVLSMIAAQAGGPEVSLVVSPVLASVVEDALVEDDALVEEDELVEITPESVRLRKRLLDENARKRDERSQRDKASAMA